MSESPDDLPEEEPSSPEPSPEQGGRPAPSEIPQHIAARILPQVGRGSLATHLVIFEGAQEFVLDFVLRLATPHAVVARVVVAHGVFPHFVAALRENVRLYETRIGPLPPPPTHGLDPSSQQLEDIYDQLKVPEELLGGTYANAVMIGHTQAEFWFDFITNFYPRSAVCARVYMSAPQISRVLAAMSAAYETFHRKRGGS